jgi:hypothetical protein
LQLQELKRKKKKQHKGPWPRLPFRVHCLVIRRSGGEVEENNLQDPKDGEEFHFRATCAAKNISTLIPGVFVELHHRSARLHNADLEDGISERREGLRGNIEGIQGGF